MDIPGYTLKRTLGKGGMASVYLAVQDKFERDVALKVMAPALSADPSFRERFLREAKIVAKISHPHIVAVYDVNEVNGIHYIAMEFHPGGDLKARIREGLSIRESLGILRDVAKALDYAHSKGYLHRDIKPDNVLFRNDGSAVLTDFGIAKATEGDANLTQLGLVAGTPKYMSPEQARGQALSADSDLYSLGVVFYEMLTGRLPYEAADPIALGIMHLNSPIPKLEGRLAHFQPLLDQLLAKVPELRPKRGAEVVQAIDALEASFDFSQPEAAASDDDATVFRPGLQNAKPAAAVKPVTAPVAAAPAASADKKAPWPAIAAVVAVLVGGGAYVALKPHAATTPAVVAPAASPVQPQLEAAAAAYARGDLVAPAGQSAADYYRQALAREPGNSIALTGMQQIASALQQKGFAALGQHDLAGAEADVAQLKAVLPEYSGLPALQNAIADAQAEKAAVAAPVAAKHEAAAHAAAKPAATEQAVADDPLKRLKISGLLGGGQQALADGDKAMAASRFHQVLQMDPGNSEAKEGLRKAQAN